MADDPVKRAKKPREVQRTHGKVHGDVQRRYSIHIPLLDMQVVLPQYQAAKKRL